MEAVGNASIGSPNFGVAKRILAITAQSQVVSALRRAQIITVGLVGSHMPALALPLQIMVATKFAKASSRPFAPLRDFSGIDASPLYGDSCTRGRVFVGIL